MNHTSETVKQLVENQRKYFSTGETLSVSWRIARLKRLRQLITENEEAIEEALHKDLLRSKTEAYLLDICPTLLEIDEIIRSLRKWAKPEVHFSGLLCFPSIITKVFKMPYGVTLIISPFNFPVLLTFGVLACAVSGGNTAVIKASSKSSACTSLFCSLIPKYFDENYIAVVDGGHDIADICLNQRFDKIFYTGSPVVGKKVLSAAASNLTPVALELGGENGNWAIVRSDADIKDAARKIAFFKICNSGQICIDVNQVAVAADVADDFIRAIKAEFERQLGTDPLDNEDYCRLINRTAYERCSETVGRYSDRIVFGGKGCDKTFRFEPTVIYPVGIQEEIVRRELFSPVLPIVPFEDSKADELVNEISSREHGLALYVFTGNKKWAEKVMSQGQFGGGCINEVCMHLMVPGTPFNGTGHSGMGAYHGEWGFREFTHPKTVLYGKTRLNLSLREHPYTKRKLDIIKQF